MNTLILIISILVGIALYCVIGFAFGHLCRYLFEIKGHTDINAFVIGFFLNFIGLLYGFFLPNLNPPEQKLIIVKENDKPNQKDEENS